MAREVDCCVHFPAFSSYVVLDKPLYLPANLLSCINPVGIVDIRTVYVFVQCLVKWVALSDVKCSGQKGWKRIKKIPLGDG